MERNELEWERAVDAALTHDLWREIEAWHAINQPVTFEPSPSVFDTPIGYTITEPGAA